MRGEVVRFAHEGARDKTFLQESGGMACKVSAEAELIRVRLRSHEVTATLDARARIASNYANAGTHILFPVHSSLRLSMF